MRAREKCKGAAQRNSVLPLHFYKRGADGEPAYLAELFLMGSATKSGSGRGDILHNVTL
jgi:hypothetical protein